LPVARVIGLANPERPPQGPYPAAGLFGRHVKSA
jgi:hypothetical protein